MGFLRHRLPTGTLLVCLALLGGVVSRGSAQGHYDFGNPTPDEQLQIELINRARANPPAEGLRLATTTDGAVTNAYGSFAVDLLMMQDEFDAIPPQPPLAPNAALTSAARGHSAWMLANAYQNHNQSLTNTPTRRIEDSGYPLYWAGENIYAYAKSGWHGHAGFQVDWGVGTGGMQDPRGHRDSIHNGNFREIGVGIVFGTNSGPNGPVGPQLITQDFGSEYAGPNYATGVAYYDLNGNDFYDLGEEIPGLTVNVAGASQSCLTADGGGWVVPVPNTALTRSVTFNGPHLLHNFNIDIPADGNAKLDLKLPYTRPVITSSNLAVSGTSSSVTFATVPAATLYRWQSWTDSGINSENCDSTSHVTTSTSGSYQVLVNTVKHSGTASLRLCNPARSNQWLELNQLFHGGDSPVLNFYSRLRYSQSSERFAVEVREVGSVVWEELDYQEGYNGPGESAFTPWLIDLSPMSGKVFQVRFALHFDGGLSYSGFTDDRFGWFIDDIVLEDCTGLEPAGLQTTAGTSLEINPSAGKLFTAVTPMIGSHTYPAAYQALTVSAAVEPVNSGFDDWAEGWEAAESLPAGALSDPLGDHDGDGRVHLVEYAFGMSPVSADDDTSRMPSMSIFAGAFLLTYQCDTTLPGLTLEACASTDGSQWFAVGEPGAPEGFTESSTGTSGGLETRRAAVPMSGHPRLFMRVRVVGE